MQEPEKSKEFKKSEESEVQPPVRKRRQLLIVSGIAIVGLAAWLIGTNYLEIGYYFKRLPGIRRFFVQSKTRDLAQQYAAAVHERIQPVFKKAGVTYPPQKIAFVALKKYRKFLVYACGEDGNFKYICDYPILGASGHLGPKLKEGDLQVPEGIYKLTLEPNTPYHAGLRLNYPNEIDLARAAADGRANPGSDILVHGTNGSIGCIAMGDPVSEDLFVLAYDTHDKNLPLIVAPVDLRTEAPPDATADAPKWLPDLYSEIKTELSKYPPLSPQ